MKKLKFFVTLMLLSIVFLSLVQVIVSNRLSTTGLDLSKIEEKISFYEKENLILKEKFLLVSSFVHISSTAGELGFVQEKKEVSLTTPLPLAVRQ